jgi:hypothetical protein
MISALLTPLSDAPLAVYQEGGTMANLKMRVELNKGRKGISLEKLEKMARELRKFLTQISEDLKVDNPSDWTGIDFRNGSLSYTALLPSPVSQIQSSSFASSVQHLARNESVTNLRSSTRAQFRELVEPLDPEEKVRLGVYPPEKRRAQWLTVSRATLGLPVDIVLPERETIGSAQGIIHSLFKESREPYFNLRDLYSGNLIKCLYVPDHEHYDAIVEALKVQDRVVHVHGLIRTITGKEKQIDSITVDRILLADPYTYDDVLKFFDSEASQ